VRKRRREREVAQSEKPTTTRQWELAWTCRQTCKMRNRNMISSAAIATGYGRTTLANDVPLHPNQGVMTHHRGCKSSMCHQELSRHILVVQCRDCLPVSAIFCCLCFEPMLVLMFVGILKEARRVIFMFVEHLQKAFALGG
jgi:hypothetical protein